MPKFWYGRAKIPVKKNYTLGYENKFLKIQKNFDFFFFKLFFKVPKLWYGRAKISVKKTTLSSKPRLRSRREKLLIHISRSQTSITKIVPNLLFC